MAQTEIGYILKQDIIRQLFNETLTELTGGSKAIGANPATAGDDKIWRDNVTNEVEEMMGYTRHWYDMYTETRPFYEFSAAEAATAGQRIASVEDVDGNRTLYTCILAAPAGTELTNITYYTPGDDRNQVLVKVVAVLVIYRLSGRYNPRQVPELRRMDYEDAIKTLEKISTGKITLNIAERADVLEDDPGHEMSFGDFTDTTNDAY